MTEPAKPTPGPWRYIDGGIVVDSDGDRIASVSWRSATFNRAFPSLDAARLSLAETAANGRAIVALPDLIAALRRARHMIEREADNRGAAGLPDSDYEREPIELLAAIDAALAKVDAK